MDQIPVIKTGEQLNQYVAELLKKEPPAPPSNEFSQFSVRPFNQGRTVLAVQDGNAETTSMYSVWMAKGPSGRFDQPVLMKVNDTQAFFDREARTALTPELADNIRRLNGLNDVSDVPAFLKSVNIRVQDNTVSTLDLISKKILIEPDPNQDPSKNLFRVADPNIAKAGEQILAMSNAMQNASAIALNAEPERVVLTAAIQDNPNIRILKVTAPQAAPTVVPSAPVASAPPVARTPSWASVEQLAAQNYTAALGGVQRVDADQPNHMDREIGYRDAYAGMTKLQQLMGEYINAQGSAKMEAQKKIIDLFGPSEDGRNVGITPGYRQIAVEYIRESLALERSADTSQYSQQVQNLYEANSNVDAVKEFLNNKDLEIKAILDEKKPKRDFAASTIEGVGEPLKDVFSRAHGYEAPVAHVSFEDDNAPAVETPKVKLAGAALA
jgi:hypothetical protein